MTQREIKRQLSKAKEQEEKISLGLSSAIKATGLWIDTPLFLDMLIGITDVLTFAITCKLRVFIPGKFRRVG